MRVATFLLASLVGLTACTDVRDFTGGWTGERAGGSSPSQATMTIDAIDKHGVRGAIRIDGFINSTFSSLESAEADVLATMTFAGAPLRVYLAFVPETPISPRDILAIISLYDSRRIELRLIRGDPAPHYDIYALHEID